MSEPIDAAFQRIEWRLRALRAELETVRAERDRLRLVIAEMEGASVVGEVIGRSESELDADEWWRLTSDAG